MQKKSIATVRIKDADQGIIEAVFASHLISAADLKSAPADVIDKDGDVTLKGAFPSGSPVVISAYGHTSWDGQLPIGKGVIREVGDLAIMEGQFFMDTTQGRDAFLTVKALSEAGLQEWSYSLQDVKASSATVAGRRVRVLEEIGTVKEVSPVLVGAGVETRTLAVKGHRKQLESSVRSLLRAAGRSRWTGWVSVEDYDLDEGFVVYCIEDFGMCEERLVQVDFTRTDTAVTLGDAEVEVHETEVYLPKGGQRLQFSEHIDQVLASVDELTARAEGVVALRAEKGKSLSDATAGQLAKLADRLDAVKSLIPTATPPINELALQHAKFIALTQGVTL